MYRNDSFFYRLASWIFNPFLNLAFILQKKKGEREYLYQVLKFSEQSVSLWVDLAGHVYE